MAVDVISGDWNGEDGALQIAGDKPTIRFASGTVAGSQSWITQVGSDGPGNFEFYTQTMSAPSSWAFVMALATNGSVGIGESNPFGQATGKLIVSVVTSPNLNAVVGLNSAPAATAANGGWFVSANGEGVRGQTATAAHGGVVGVNTGGGDAVYGISEYGGTGIHGVANGSKMTGTTNSIGVVGDVDAGTGTGVYGHCTNGLAIHAIADEGIALLAEAKGPTGSIAGQFNGAVVVNGNITVSGDIQLTNADCAEDFDVADLGCAEPGTVMSLDDSGSLVPCWQAFDKRVAGVVSGAGTYKPAIVLDQQRDRANRAPIALLGKVYCKVDALQHAIEIGDLLTTSATPGHAMKATAWPAAFGAVIGKALQPLAVGQCAQIPILIALQ